MAKILAISKNDVHQICSGQVILDLATAVKELVENSLDAGATTIDVRLKEYGCDQIEILDNGSGVEENNFESLTLKHHTSKLQEFSDLSCVSTFGFRGEALSSLCALCKVSVSTRHAKSRLGHKLDYDHNGFITSKTGVARKIGTDIVLKKIFSTLPVRYKEFTKNIKKEYTKMLSILSAYCIISTHVKITCINQVGKGKKNVVLSTQNCSSLQQNISSIYGPKQLQTLKEFIQQPPSQDVCDDYNIKMNDAIEIYAQYKITGMISDIVHGYGRSSPDRQFLFINSRPTDIQRMSKVINDVYHTFNRHQYPFVALNIAINRDTVDINVTPNKRQVFIQNEKVLLATVKTSLLFLYSKNQTHEVGSIVQSSLSNFLLSKDNGMEQPIKQEINHELRTNQKKDEILSNAKPLDETFPKSFMENNLKAATKFDTKVTISNMKSNNTDSILSKFRHSSTLKQSLNRKRTAHTPVQTKAKHRRTSNFPIKTQPIDDYIEESFKSEPSFKVELISQDKNSVEKNNKPFLNQEINSRNESPHIDIKNFSTENNSERVVYDEKIEYEKPSTTIKISISKIKESLKRIKNVKTPTNEDKVSFKAVIDPNQNESAQNELSRILKKEAFNQMKALGQFNLGFVIARFKNDLFIIDQHASDEIYNFETLQKSDSIHQQVLVVPQKLQLTAADKLILLNDIEIFQKNGFDFNIDNDDISLSKVPMSKNWQFGSTDVEELIFMLNGSPGVMCRPSRLRQMFASRACRKAVMIGTALNKHGMQKILSHMSEINHP